MAFDKSKGTLGKSGKGKGGGKSKGKGSFDKKGGSSKGSGKKGDGKKGKGKGKGKGKKSNDAESSEWKQNRSAASWKEPDQIELTDEILAEISDLTSNSWMELQKSSQQDFRSLLDQIATRSAKKEKESEGTTASKKKTAALSNVTLKQLLAFVENDDEASGASEDAASALYDEKAKLFNSVLMMDEEQQWLAKMAQTGTMSDKIASMRMHIEAAPLLSLPQLKKLIQMAQKNNRAEAGAAIDALVELTAKEGNGVLPDDRKLSTWTFLQDACKQLVLNGESSSGKGGLSSKLKGAVLDTVLTVDEATVARKIQNSILLTRYFEDSLKIIYGGLISCVRSGAFDQVSFHKTKCVQHFQTLLVSKPEQEHVLLENLVNKFGDSESKVSSLVAKLCVQVVAKQPLFKSIVAREIERFVRKPNQTQKGRYMATLFLTEMTLKRHHDMNLALQIVNFYTHVLDMVLGSMSSDDKTKKDKDDDKPKLTGNKKEDKKRRGKFHKKQEVEEADNRLVRAVITGVKRAIPYLSPEVDMKQFDDMIERMFKVYT